MRLSWLTKKTALVLLFLVALDAVLFLVTTTNIALTSPYLALVLGLTLLMLIAYTFSHLKRLDKGADGEYAVKRELNKLPPEYIHLIDFNYNNKNSTDFVVIGPTGVFTIEVKNYGAKNITFQNSVLLGDNKPLKKDVLSQAYAEMKNLQEYLRAAGILIPVQPIVAFTNHKTIVRFGLTQLKGVTVIGLPWLQKAILEQPPMLTSEQCIAIKNVIQKYTSVA